MQHYYSVCTHGYTYCRIYNVIYRCVASHSSSFKTPVERGYEKNDEKKGYKKHGGGERGVSWPSSGPIPPAPPPEPKKEVQETFFWRWTINI
jgi:hypothetical protein